MGAAFLRYVRRHHLGLLALFIALGGTSYAATLPRNSVGPKQLKNRAVTTPKIRRGAVDSTTVKNGSLRGDDIDPSSLGTVPRARAADSAGSAGSAATAGRAASAGTAGNAIRLGGLTASAFARAPNCPADTVFHEGACVERVRRSTNLQYAASRTDCNDEERRLPTIAELQTARVRPGFIEGVGSEWTSTIGFSGSDPISVAVQPSDGGQAFAGFALSKPYRCVAPVP